MASSVNFAKTHARFVKKFGGHSILAASDTKALSHIPYGISSQCLALDLAIGRPGFPSGRMSEIVGKTNQGKSTLGYHVLLQCQKEGGIGALFETENAYEEWRLEQLGIDTKALQVIQPDSVEQLYSEMEEFILDVRVSQKFKGPMVFVVDTIARLMTDVEVEGKYDDKFMAVGARAHSIGLRKFTRVLAEHKVVLLYLNQLTSTLAQWGEQLSSYGGAAIHSNASVRVQLVSKKGDLVRVGGKAVAGWTEVTMLKNKLESPFDKTKYLLHFSTGIDFIEDLWQSARQLRVIIPTQKGTKFSLAGKTVIVTRETFEQFVMEKFKSPAALRERLTKLALEQGLLRPYGEAK